MGKLTITRESDWNCAGCLLGGGGGGGGGYRQAGKISLVVGGLCSNIHHGISAGLPRQFQQIPLCSYKK